MRDAGPGNSIRAAATPALVLALALVLVLAACSGSDTPQERGTGNDARPTGGLQLPLRVGRSKSDRRATITTTIGGASQSLLFDTGSTGISVLATAVPAGFASMTGDPVQETFGGGVVLSGVTVSVPVEVAGRATSGPIPIRLIRTATCETGVPNCAAKDGIAAFAASIGADGILGAGLWSDGPVSSPLTQLASGVPASIAVTWNGRDGSVTLDPELRAEPVATLQMPAADPPSLPNGANAWDNLSVPSCWRIGTSQRSCTATALDIGAAAMSFPIGFPGGPTTNVQELAPGQRISASVSADAAPFLGFTTGRKLGRNLVTVIPGQPFVDSGMQFFDEFVVVFSLTAGSVHLFRA